MSKCTVSYIDENGELFWKCPKSLIGSSSKIPIIREKCYVYNCPGRSEYKVKKDIVHPQETVLIPIVQIEIRTCEAVGCLNTLERESQLKFCSKRCGNRDRKQKSRLRQKQMRDCE